MSVNGFDFDGTVHRYNYNSLDNIPPNIAPAYSASSTYAVGDYCTKDNVLYKCSTAIATAEAWNSAHWTQVQLATDVADLKDAFIDYQLGELPMFIVKDSYVKTDGTIASYTGWDRTEYVPVSKYQSMIVKSSVASDYNVFFDASYTKVGNFFGVKTTAKSIDIPSGAVYVIFSNSATGMQNLEVSFKTKAEQDIDDQGVNLTNINSILDGYNILKYELPSGSSVGTNWNNTYVKNIPFGTNLTIIFKGYSGSNFTRLAIFGQKLNDDYTELKTIYSNTETEINIVTSEAYKNLYFGLVRSAAESPVSYTVYLKGDYGELLGSDVIKMQVRSEGQDDRIKMLEVEQKQMVHTHFNLFDMCTFDDGYVYSSTGNKVSAEGNSVATPIRVLSGKTYYAKNTRCYFSFFIYDDGTNERIGESDSVYSGAFTPSKNGYAYLTTETGHKTSCVWTEDYSLYTSSRNATYFLPNKLELGIEGNHIFRVGTGREYTSILECVIAAEQHKNSIVYVDPGTYDMVQEFKDKYGNDYFTSENYLSQTNHRGCPLNNGIHIIGYGGVVVTGGLASTDSQDAIGDWSIFAAGDDTNGDNGYGFILENITVKSVSQHIRYLIHDEYGATDYNYINKYINCHFIVFPGYVKRCIGGGLGKHGYILIDNCTIDAPAYDETIRGINYHNDAGAGALNEIYIKNCYIPNGTVGITWYGQTPASEKSIMYVNNCYLQAEPVKRAETATAPYENVDIVSWRNTIAP